MKAKTRTICIELVCFSILCLLPLMGNSLNVIDSRFHKNLRSKAKDHNRNTPSILSIPIDDTIDINSAKHDISRFKRNSQGNLYSIKTSEIAPLIFTTCQTILWFIKNFVFLRWLRTRSIERNASFIIKHHISFSSE